MTGVKSLLSLHGSNGAVGPDLLPARIILTGTEGLKSLPEEQPPKSAS